MRCKPGDLAVIVNGKKEFSWSLGRIVRVIRLTKNWLTGNPSWIFSPAMTSPIGEEVISVDDDCLRPIRPGDTSNPRLVAEDLRNRNKVAARRFDAAREKAQQLRDRFDSESA